LSADRVEAASIGKSLKACWWRRYRWRAPAKRKEQTMNVTAALVPGPEHPITIEPNGSRVVIRFHGRLIADTRRARTLTEANYPPVQYIPREDAKMGELVPSEHVTYCPYKGECSYFSIRDGGEAGTNAVWTYNAPYAAVSEIAGHLAFSPDKVDLAEAE
jgi:uncharacterized protein (DUF427 family)